MKTPTPQMNDTQAIILGILHMGQMHGGEIMREAEKMSPFFSVTRSQVYRELPTLLAWGYVRLGKPGVRLAQPYIITPKGKRAFQVWMDAVPERATMRQPFVARLWFSWLREDEHMESLVKSASEYHREELKRAEEMQEEAVRADDLGAAAAYGFCVMYHSMILGWLREALV